MTQPSDQDQSARSRRRPRGPLGRMTGSSSFGVRRELARARRTARGSVMTATGVWATFIEWFNAREFSENAILLGFAVIIGAAGALGVVGFYKLIDLAYALFYEWPVGRLPPIDLWFYRPVVTAAGLMLAWWIVHRLGRAYDGMNVADVQLAVARRGAYLPMRPAVAKTAAGAITLGCGGSAGSEGPVAVIGSVIGSFAGRAFGFDVARIRVLVGAGAAAGISAAFNAPLAGAFFALEEVLGSLAVRAFPPVVVSSVMAAVVSRAFFGNHPAFPIPEDYGYGLTREVILFYPLLGILAGFVAAFFVRTYFAADAIVRKLKVPPLLLAGLAGLVVGTMVTASSGELVGFGHLALRLDLFGRMPLLVLCLLAVGKIVATSITLNAGGSGGVFTPSLYIGAVTGGAFGVLLTQVFPALQLSPEPYALVGMGAVVAAATAAPITGILIVFEMTNDYAIVLPMMLATAVAMLVAHRIEPDSLYSGWLRRRGENLEHGRNRDVLEGLAVSDALDADTAAINENATVTELLAHLAQAGHSDFPVVDDDGLLVGIITMADIGRAAKDHADLADILVASDLALPTETVKLDDSLLEAIRRLGIRGSSMLPVVDGATGKLVGTTSRTRILAHYERAVLTDTAV